MHPSKSILTGAVLATAFTLASAFVVQAATINNGSFEFGPDPGQYAAKGTGDTSITDWTVTAGNIDYIGTYWTAADGGRSLDMNGTVAGTIQTTIIDLSAGVQYRVSFDLAGNPDGGPAVKQLDAFSASTSTNSFFFDTSGRNRTNNMGWTTYSFLFTASGPTELLTFASQVTGGGTEENPTAFGPALDNVRIEETPLPAALPLFAGALGVLGLVARRRKKKAQAVAV
jgi:choice-of-anchor C domain-containing protein